TNILDLETPDGSVGENPGDAFGQTPTAGHRVNVDVVNATGFPTGTTFLTARVNGADGSIFLGQNQFFPGELVKYQATGGVLGGLTNNNFYYVVADDGFSIQLASVDSPTTPILIDPTGLAATDSHLLTPAQRFTVK